ncbi:unnamed protein product [Rotaria sp. Silwood2]|nr:unnamed protein product [Rotaria sp. Silwood2]
MAIQYLKRNSWFNVEIRTYFGTCHVQVVILSDLDSSVSTANQLDPIQTAIRAYHEFVIDSNSIDDIDSPLSTNFRLLFYAFKRIGHDKVDSIMASYCTEMECRNYRSDVLDYVLHMNLPQTEQEIQAHFDQILKLLKQTQEESSSTDETRETARFLEEGLRKEIEGAFPSLFPTSNGDVTRHQGLIPLNLDFTQRREDLRNLHSHYDIHQVRDTLKVIMAPFYFILIKLRRLPFIQRYTFTTKMSQYLKVLSFQYQEKEKSTSDVAKTGAMAIATGAAMAGVMHLVRSTRQSSLYTVGLGLVGGMAAASAVYRAKIFGQYEKLNKSLTETVALLLQSTDSHEDIHNNMEQWELLYKIVRCHWSQQLTEARSIEERDDIWTRTFSKEPLKEISSNDRSIFVGVIGLCRQLCSMRQILLQQPPKIVILGRSQMGKSTLFRYLTGRDLKELRSSTQNNTRMSLKCRAFIKLKHLTRSAKISGDSTLPVDVVDNPGFDDATDQHQCLLTISLDGANLVIIVSTLDDLNMKPTIELLDKILHLTKVKILVLINKVDIRLSDEWRKFKNKYDINDSDDENDYANQVLDKSFDLNKKLDEIMAVKQEELINSLTKTSSCQVKNRVTFLTVVLAGFNDLQPTFKEPT